MLLPTPGFGPLPSFVDGVDGCGNVLEPGFHVLAFAGTRPEIIKLACLHRALLRRRPGIKAALVLLAQHRQLADQTIRSLDLGEMVIKWPAPSRMSLREYLSAAAAIRQFRPQLVIVQGDTRSAYQASVAAHLARTPVAHVEAGLRTGDESNPWPEEIYRRRITRVATWHFAPTPSAARNLLAEGIPADSIVTTGNTGIDTLHWMLGQPDTTLDRPVHPYVLVTVHRRESAMGGRLTGILAAVVALARRFPDLEWIYSIHPNPAAVRAAANVLAMSPPANFKALDAFPYREFVGLVRDARLVLTDSGGLQEEAAALATPCLVLRSCTERAEGIAAGVAALVGTDPGVILETATAILADPVRLAAMAAGPIDLYGDGRASRRICKVIEAVIRGFQSGDPVI